MAKNGEREEFGVSNPHPGFGKDKNIANEFGHTVYPKYVTNKDGNAVVVQNAKEEEEITGKKPKGGKAPEGGWGKTEEE